MIDSGLRYELKRANESIAYALRNEYCPADLIRYIKFCNQLIERAEEYYQDYQYYPVGTTEHYIFQNVDYELSLLEMTVELAVDKMRSKLVLIRRQA